MANKEVYYLVEYSVFLESWIVSPIKLSAVYYRTKRLTGTPIFPTEKDANIYADLMNQ